MSALAGFAKSLKVKYQDIEIAFDEPVVPGLADNGDLEGDLTALLAQVGQAAKAAGTAVAIFVDELQYLPGKEFGALISALHRCSQDQLPVMLVGAGLPQLPALVGNAKSYAERMFAFPPIGALSEENARLALVGPARELNVSYTDAALAAIFRQTQGYAYFVQEWGKHAWNEARQSPIEADDVERARISAMAALDASFFLVRLDRVTPKERHYLRAMAALGRGPYRSGDVAQQMGKSSSAAIGTLRQELVAKGMIWSQSHGEIAYTVPLFDDFMKRIMPGDEWRTEI